MNNNVVKLPNIEEDWKTRKMAITLCPSQKYRFEATTLYLTFEEMGYLFTGEGLPVALPGKSYATNSIHHSNYLASKLELVDAKNHPKKTHMHLMWGECGELKNTFKGDKFGELSKTTKKESRETVEGLCLDIENDGTNEFEHSIESLTALLKEKELAYILYSSSSHRADKPRFRVLVPFTHSVPPAMLESRKSALKEYFGEGIDPKSYLYSQIFCMPVKFKDLADCYVEGVELEGNALNVKTFKEEVVYEEYPAEAGFVLENVPESINGKLEALVSLYLNVPKGRPILTETYLAESGCSYLLEIIPGSKHKDLLGRNDLFYYILLFAASCGLPKEAVRILATKMNLDGKRSMVAVDSAVSNVRVHISEAYFSKATKQDRWVHVPAKQYLADAFITQFGSLEATLLEFSQYKSILVEATTGLGKSTAFTGQLPFGKKIIFAAPNILLVNQLYAEAVFTMGTSDVSVVHGDIPYNERDWSKKLTITTWSQLASLYVKDAKIKLQDYVVVVDEIHKILEDTDFRAKDCVPLVSMYSETAAVGSTGNKSTRLLTNERANEIYKENSAERRAKAKAEKDKVKAEADRRNALPKEELEALLLAEENQRLLDEAKERELTKEKEARAKIRKMLMAQQAQQASSVIADQRIEGASTETSSEALSTTNIPSLLVGLTGTIDLDSIGSLFNFEKTYHYKSKRPRRTLQNIVVPTGVSSTSWVIGNILEAHENGSKSMVLLNKVADLEKMSDLLQAKGLRVLTLSRPHIDDIEKYLVDQEFEKKYFAPASEEKLKGGTSWSDSVKAQDKDLKIQAKAKLPHIDLCDTGMFGDYDVLLHTQVILEGFSIKDPAVKNIYILGRSWRATQIIQYMERLRLFTNETHNAFLVYTAAKDSKDYTVANINREVVKSTKLRGRWEADASTLDLDISDYYNKLNILLGKENPACSYVYKGVDNLYAFNPLAAYFNVLESERRCYTKNVDLLKPILSNYGWDLHVEGGSSAIGATLEEQLDSLKEQLNRLKAPRARVIKNVRALTRKDNPRNEEEIAISQDIACLRTVLGSKDEVKYVYDLGREAEYTTFAGLKSAHKDICDIFGNIFVKGAEYSKEDIVANWDKVVSSFSPSMLTTLKSILHFVSPRDGIAMHMFKALTDYYIVELGENVNTTLSPEELKLHIESTNLDKGSSNAAKQATYKIINIGKSNRPSKLGHIMEYVLSDYNLKVLRLERSISALEEHIAIENEAILEKAQKTAALAAFKAKREAKQLTR